MQTPRVSVIMSVYNAELYLRAAIESILEQTFTDYEFIIIDDGSTDNSAEIIRSYEDSRIRLLQQENRGISASLNRGIGLSKGEYIARMDADDISECHRLERQVEYMDDNPDYVLVGTNALLIDKDGQLLRTMEMPQQQEAIRQELQWCASPFVHGSVLFKKIVVSQYGLYDEHMFSGQDWHLCTKIVQAGKMTNLPELLYRRRLNPEAISITTPRRAKVKMAIQQRILKSGVLTAEDAEQLRLLRQGISPRRRWAQYYLGVGKALIEGDWQPVRARRHIWQSVCLSSWNPVSWVNLAFCFLPRGWVSGWKRRRIRG